MFNRSFFKTAFFISLLSLPLVSRMAFAGDSDDDLLEGVWDTLVDWTQGTLGRVITLLFIVTGIAAGVIRQSLFSFVVGVGAGLGLYNAPTVIGVVFGASMEAANTASAVIPLVL